MIDSMHPAKKYECLILSQRDVVAKYIVNSNLFVICCRRIVSHYIDLSINKGKGSPKKVKANQSSRLLQREIRHRDT